MKQSAPRKWYKVPQCPTQTADQPSRADASGQAGGAAEPSIKMNSSHKPAGTFGGQLARAKRAAAWNSLTSPSSIHNLIPRPALCRRAARGSASKTRQRASRGPRGPSGRTEASASPVAATTPATKAARAAAAAAPASDALQTSEPAETSASSA